MRGRYTALAILALAAGVTGGILFERERGKMAMGEADHGSQILYWVAPMDTNFRKDGPGKSPMGMDLVPVYEGVERLLRGCRTWHNASKPWVSLDMTSMPPAIFTRGLKDGLNGWM